MAPSQCRALLFALCVRLFIALSTQTFFQPDEHFQSLEVAHHAVFGYGHLTWEWMSPAPIRSPLYPALYMPVYMLLRLARLDHTHLLVLLPKVMNAFVAFLVDIGLCKMTERVLGQRFVTTALFLSLTSLFNALSLTRSLSNSLETSLTAIAFSHFPWEVASLKRTDQRKCLAFAALACAVRPTNAVVWVYAFSNLLFRLRAQPEKAIALLSDTLAMGGAALTFIFTIDSLYYRTPTFTPLNFALTNLRVSSFYGINQWHFYITQALPLLCTTALPFVLHGALLLMRSRTGGTAKTRAMLGVVAWSGAVYSLGAHKEWRFLHPLLPLLHVCAAKSLVDLNDDRVKSSSSSAPPSSAQADPSAKGHRRNNLLPPIRPVHLALLLLNVPAAYYVLRWHGAAQISVMHYLRGVPPRQLDSLGFLMPCHSTPWQAHLHRPELAESGRVWALGCEPPVLGEDMQGYEDQTDVFYADPAAYLKERFPAVVDTAFPPSPYPTTEPGALVLTNKDGRPAWSHQWPRVLVMFGALLDVHGTRETLVEKGYEEVWVGNNGWEEDTRRRGGVHVWIWKGSSPEEL